MKPTPPMYRPPVAPPPPGGLARYGSAPGSLLARIADSVLSGSDFIGSDAGHSVSRFFEDSASLASSDNKPSAAAVGSRSYGQPEIPPPPPPPPPPPVAPPADPKVYGSLLTRHSSSPAGFFSHLVVDNGFSVTRGMGHYSQPSSDGIHAMANRGLKSPMSFSRHDTLSHITEISIPEMGESIGGGNSPDEAAGNVTQSYNSRNYPIGSWDDTSSIVFSSPSSKRAKDNNGNIITSLNNLDSQFSLPTTSLEMEKLFQVHDSVPFKIRAKRGCATHPRSIAERERRTRISEKLRKLQELVPNMDKQTSTADMLDLAVQHIKELQGQIQILNQDRANCTCTSKQGTP